MSRYERNLHAVPEAQGPEVIGLRVPHGREPWPPEDFVERKPRVLHKSDVRVVAELDGSRIENYPRSIHVLKANRYVELEGSARRLLEPLAVEAKHEKAPPA
jgi:hypothetical protein